MSKRTILLILSILLIVSACGRSPQQATLPASDTPSEHAPDGAAPPPGYEGRAWSDILTEARGQTINFYMWGGNETINTWVTGYVAESLQADYSIQLNMIPVTDIADIVNKVLGEKQAGENEDGSVDLIWINGENFRTMQQTDLLYGPWADYLPNSVYVNGEDPSLEFDFGYPVEGYESPYGKAQFVMVYNSELVPEPPASIAALLEWIRANPGKFTYAAPPDFTGSVFVRQVCYHATGGYQQFLGEFDDSLFAEKFPDCWQTLNDLEPSLWREGSTYPENRTRMLDLFANGEIYFDMTYSPAEASSLISQGRYPESAQTFVFEEGTIANTHYLAIPFNASQKAAAMVAANFLLSPEAQYSKADPQGWGDLTALDPQKLPEEWQEKFASIPRGPATLSDEVLAAHRLPELQAGWLTAIEDGWEDFVLYGD